MKVKVERDRTVNILCEGTSFQLEAVNGLLSDLDEVECGIFTISLTERRGRRDVSKNGRVLSVREREVHRKGCHNVRSNCVKRIKVTYLQAWCSERHRRLRGGAGRWRRSSERPLR